MAASYGLTMASLVPSASPITQVDVADLALSDMNCVERTQSSLQQPAVAAARTRP